ncbi:MAG: DUF1579 family protein [Phycisphaerales bacterium]
MKSNVVRALLLAAAGGGVLFAATAREPAPENPQHEMKQMFNAAVARAKLPPEVKAALGSFVGEFATVSEVHVSPTDPMVAHATSSGKWIMGDLFVQINASSDADEELKGERMIVYGYDPAAKKYTMWQIETGNLVATTATGTFDGATKTFTFNGERELGPRGTAAVQWIIAVQPDGSLKQSLKLKPKDQAEFTEFVTVVHTKKGGK